MSECGLSSDEIRCLRMWFRNAIAEAEMKEAGQRLSGWFAQDGSAVHRHQAGRRRARRLVPASHAKEAQAV